MKLIINADDFGISPSTNEAICELANSGSITSTTVMVNMPYYEDIKELRDSVPKNLFSIGLHFNITQGKPISEQEEIRSLVDKEGNFFSPKRLRYRILAGRISLSEVQKEFTAQYERLAKLVGVVDHVDSHNDILKYRSTMKAVLSSKILNTESYLGFRTYNKTFIKQGVNTVHFSEPRISTLNIFGVKRVFIESVLRFNRKRADKKLKMCHGFLLDESMRALATLKFLTQLSQDLKSHSKVYEICCHPAKNPSDVPDTTLSATRLNEYEWLTNKNNIENLRKKIELISYNSL